MNSQERKKILGIPLITKGEPKVSYDWKSSLTCLMIPNEAWNKSATTTTSMSMDKVTLTNCHSDVEVEAPPSSFTLKIGEYEWFHWP